MITQYQISNFSLWADNALVKDARKVLSTNCLFEAYKRDMILGVWSQGKPTVPLKRKTFVTLVKRRFLNESDSPSVSFYYCNKSLVQGLDFSVRENPPDPVCAECGGGH